MGRYISQTWYGNPHALRERDRRGGRFDAYIPHPLQGWQPMLTADVVAFLAETERTLIDTVSKLTLRSGGDICFWAESLGSSHIEGVTPNPKRVVQALAKQQHTGENTARGPVAEVIGNIEATDKAQQMLANHREVDLETLLSAHRTLMASSPMPHIGGIVREEQNWIGGNDWHPLEGEFVPPPATECLPLLEDLISYLRSEEHPPVLQAAIAHAQLEMIHPFADGNGRTGRAILYGILKARCAPNNMMPPVSLALSSNRNNYLDSLREFESFIGEPNDLERSVALIRWLEVLAVAIQHSSASVLRYQEAINVLQNHWRYAIGGRSRRSVAAAVIDYLPANPSVTASTLSDATGYSQVRCANALRRLEYAGIVKSRSIGPSLRAYDADKVYDAFSVMSSTVCDINASAGAYALVLAEPFLKDSRNWSETSGTASMVLCSKKVKSTGLPCGLVRGHKGYCRSLPGRR